MSQISGSSYGANVPSSYFTDGQTYGVSVMATDNAGNVSGWSASQTFSTSTSCVAPYLQTQGGDVHSNTQINTPGGP